MAKLLCSIITFIYIIKLACSGRTISECPVYYNLLKVKPVSAATVDIIRGAHCRFDHLTPYVWCLRISDKQPNITGSTEKPVEKTTRNIEITLEDKLADTKPTTQIPFTNKPVINTKAPAVVPTGFECGTQDYVDRILGGSETGIDEFPWLAILQFYSPRRLGLYNGCGGVLINNRYVLTAAHCITQPAGAPLSVLLGEYDTKNTTDCQNDGSAENYCSLPPVAIIIEAIEIHPNWQKDRRSGDDDIALIRLATTVNFTEFVKPICLPNKSFSASNIKNYIVAGWGRTETGKISNIKLKVTVPFVSRDTCSTLLNRPINDGIICAGGVKGKDSCTGDSGGPLMYLDLKTATWRAAGIVSIGPKGCGREEIPAIYTNIAKYMDWVLQTISP